MTSSVVWPTPWAPTGLSDLIRKIIGGSIVAVKSNVNVWADRSLPPWIDPFLGQMQTILALEPGWDGSNGRRMSIDALTATLTVLQETMAWDTVAPAVVPVADGGVQLEWHCAGVDLEVYVEPDGQVSAWCQEGSREWEEDFYPRARLSKELSLLTNAFCH